MALRDSFACTAPITASAAVPEEGLAAFSIVEPEILGTGGNIEIQGDATFLRNSIIEASSTGGPNNGGNIEFTGNRLFVFDGSQIAANAVQGDGGNISIDSEGFFLTANSAISATSQLGLDGTINVDSFSPDVENIIVSLQSPPQNFEDILANTCLDPQQKGNARLAFVSKTPTRESNPDVSQNQIIPIPRPERASTDISLYNDEWQVGDPITVANHVVDTPDGKILLVRETDEGYFAPAESIVCHASSN